MHSKLPGLLGLARRAGKLSLGYESIRRSVLSGKARAVFLTQDLSEGTARRVARMCEGRVPAVTLPLTILELGHAVGLKCGCVSVDDAGFAKSALRLSRE